MCSRCLSQELVALSGLPYTKHFYPGHRFKCCAIALKIVMVDMEDNLSDGHNSSFKISAVSAFRGPFQARPVCLPPFSCTSFLHSHLQVLQKFSMSESAAWMLSLYASFVHCQVCHSQRKGHRRRLLMPFCGACLITNKYPPMAM